MIAKSPTPKFGQGQVQAMVRLGMKELAQGLTALPDSIRPIEEPGMVGNPVPQEVFAQRHELEPEQSMEFEMGM